jgi:TIR domain-containing protein
MVGANGGGAGPDVHVRARWRWDVALSFAGAQRDYVERVADELEMQGVRCFYDADEQIDLWGKYLAEELPAIYGEQAATVVVFVSAEYAARDWTRLERRVALAKAVRERQEYVLPARFDDTPLPGLLPDMVVVDLRTRTPRQFARMIAAKLAALGVTGPRDTAEARGPAPDRGGASRLAAGCGWKRRTRGGWACTRRLACPGCQMTGCRNTWRGMWMVPGQTSDAVRLSSGLGKILSGIGEGGGFVVVLAGGQAVVQAAEHASEQVALGRGVPVAVLAAAVVVAAGAG